MVNIVDDFLESLQSHIPSLEYEEWEGEEEIFQEENNTTINFMNMGIDA